MRSLIVLTMVAVGALLAGCAGPRVSTGSLLSEMTDLKGMAEFPQPAYKCRQFSSYDRAAKSPDQDWFANADHGQFLRTEERDGRTEYVMMDARGPGAVVRIWSANPKGTLRIYLDGQKTPVLEAPMTDFLSGKVTGIPEPIAHVVSAGWNCYFPIPYARRCKITSDEQDFYYHVNYRTYPWWTRLRSFRVEELKTLAAQITDVAVCLSSPRRCLGWYPMLGLDPCGTREGREWTDVSGGDGSFTVERRMVIVPGESRRAWEANRGASGAVVVLWVDVDAEDVDRALRQVLLHMECDGEETVACPLGDFFGAAPGLNAYDSLPLGVTRAGESPDIEPEYAAAARRMVRQWGGTPTEQDIAEGSEQAADVLEFIRSELREYVNERGVLWSHWVMPFRRSASIALENMGEAPVEVALQVSTEPYEWTRRSMHFHAQWRVEHDMPTRPMRDWNYVDIDGRGVFAGAAFAIANATKTWWGEGDEKIYVDGERFPSHFGTGTEDYYGYAWGSSEPFTHAYHNQPRCDGPRSYGHTAVNRWHILDRIPFRRGFRFDMELWHWVEDLNVTASVVTYWYARPGATSNRVAPRAEDLRLPEVPEYVPARVEGALEGEEVEIVASTGESGPQEVDGCSNDHHLWWREAQPGDRLVLAFEVPEAGRHRVYGRFVKAGDYGIVQLRINDELAGDAIDFYHDRVIVSDEMLLGEFDLPAGQNQLSAEIVGANEEAVENHMFGLDYIRLEIVR